MDMNNVRDSRLVKGYYNNNTIVFFLRLFDFCEAARAFYIEHGSFDMTFSKETFQPINENMYSAEELVQIFLDFYKDESNEIKFITKIEESTGYKKNKNEKFIIDNDIEAEIYSLEDVLKELDNIFLDPDICNHIKLKLNSLKQCYKTKSNDKLWGNKEINDFLNHYYDLLCYFLYNSELLEIDEVRSIICKILNLGVIWNDGFLCYAKMISPIVLSALQLVYNRLDGYLLMNFNVDEIMIEQKAYREIFLSKIRQLFRFPISDLEHKELCQAAIPAYVSSEMEELKLIIPIRKMSTYSSYQGVRELRLGEKIIYEINWICKHLKEENNSKLQEYNIILLGDISEKPFIELADYVETKKLEMGLEDIKFNYKIYTNKVYDYNEDNALVSKKYKYNINQYSKDLLSGPKSIESLMDDGNLIFFLDNCHLYRDEIQEIDDLIVFQQRFSLDSYENYFCNLKTNNLILDCKYIDLYKALTMFSLTGKLGYVRKKAREDLIGYIKQYVQTQQSKTVYVYISDIAAFNDLQCAQEEMVRIEKYNQKKVGIIRFANWSKEVLVVSERNLDRNILVFNLWQFVKYCSINEKEYYQNIFSEDKDRNLCNLDKILIGLDYSNWKEKLVIYSYYDSISNNVDSINIGKFINIIIPKILSSQKDDMYSRCIKDAFISILYGTAKSLEDLLFVHILNQKANLVGPIESSSEYIELENYKKDGCKYSYKRIFWDALEKLDESFIGIVEEFRLFSYVKNNHLYADTVNSDDVLEDFLDKILKACNGLCYQDSFLYASAIQEVNNLALL